MKKMLLRGLATVLACLPLIAWAWPDKPIRVIVPYSAGGGADTTLRILAPHMSETLGQSIIVENKPGAGGVIGAEQVAKSAADGYTVLYDASAFSVNPTLRKTPYDATTDFIPVSLVATAPQILVVPADAPWRNLTEFIAHARQHPNTLSFASAGAGTGSHLAAEALSEQAGIRLLHIPYKGGAQALIDVIGAQVNAYFGNVASTLGYVQSGKLRALAISATHRLAALPDVPTLAQAGLPGDSIVEWNGIFLPKGTPPDIVTALNAAIRAAIHAPAINSRLIDMGLEPADTTPDAFASFVQTEINRVAALLKTRQIRLD